MHEFKACQINIYLYIIIMLLTFWNIGVTEAYV